MNEEIVHQSTNQVAHHSGGAFSIILIIVLIIITGGIIMRLTKGGKVISDTKENKDDLDLTQENILNYSDLEKELKEKFKPIGIEWDNEFGIYSIYISLLRGLINDILRNIDKNVEDVIKSFETDKCGIIKNIEISKKYNTISEPLNLSMEFQKEGVSSQELNQKIKELAKKYCEKAVNRVREKISVELKYNNKEGIKKVLEEMKEEL